MTQLRLIIRTEAHYPTASLWLVEGKTAIQCLMHGTVDNKEAEEVAEQMERAGFEVQREVCPYRCADDQPLKAVASQRGLFELTGDQS